MTLLEHDWFPREVPPNVHIGEGSWLYSSFAFLHFRSTRPDAVTIGAHSGVYIGSMFDLGSQGSVRIGNYCAIAGPVISTNAHVEIGNYSLISYSVTIAGSPFAVPPPEDDRSESADIVIGDDTWIGARATILGG